MRKVVLFLNKVKNSVKIFRDFGLIIGVLDFLDECLIRNKGKVGKKIHYIRHEIIKKRLKITYGDILTKYSNFDICKDKIPSTCTIWFFWWQGIDNAPIIVKECYQNILENKGEYDLIIIDKDNCRKYVNLPEYIYEKLNNGFMSITHFSDVYRVNILAQRGGIWMDSTVWAMKGFEKELSIRSFYTIKHGMRSNYHVCKGLWASFFLASPPNNPLLNYMSEVLLEYWKVENISICYLLIDCFLALGYENIECIKLQIDELEYNNPHVLDLQHYMNDTFSEVFYNKLINENRIFKLTYKKSFIKEKNKQLTIYGYLTQIAMPKD